MWWRTVTLLFAFRKCVQTPPPWYCGGLLFDFSDDITALAVMTNVAIFSCNYADNRDIQTPGTKCHRTMSLSAPAEWLYAATTVSWGLTVAFDIYITPIVNSVKSVQDREEFLQVAGTPIRRIGREFA